jgi:gamma-glutamyl-gamma-aminobutyraldehyde dehydrogenase
MKQTISVPGHDPINLNIGAYIDGAFCPSISGRTIPSINPATGETLVQIADCGTEDVDLAVSSARKAFEIGGWRTE